jgi:hypothetical protein
MPWRRKFVGVFLFGAQGAPLVLTIYGRNINSVNGIQNWILKSSSFKKILDFVICTGRSAFFIRLKVAQMSTLQD